MTGKEMFSTGSGKISILYDRDWLVLFSALAFAFRALPFVASAACLFVCVLRRLAFCTLCLL